MILTHTASPRSSAVPLAMALQSANSEIVSDSVKTSEAIVAGDFNQWNAASTSLHKDTQILGRTQPEIASVEPRQNNPRAVSSMAGFRDLPPSWEHGGIND
jgi:hypothetical protein